MISEIGCSATLAPGISRPGLPYLYSGDLEASLSSINALGYDAVEILLPDLDFISAADLAECLSSHALKLAAIGTGGAFINGKLHLCSPNESIRRRAEDYVLRAIDLASQFGAAVNLGLVTGIVEDGVTRDHALGWLIPALERIGTHASGGCVAIEPLNRYEGNLINSVDDGLELLRCAGRDSLKLLADLFHMNIEEGNMADAIRRAGRAIGHVHFVDSNRCGPGMGHTDFGPIIDALDDVAYSGYLSIEALPIPDRDTAARDSLAECRRLLAYHGQNKEEAV